MHRERYEPSPAMPAQQFPAPCRGFFAALFGGASVPAVAASEAPSVPAEWSWPANDSEYRGKLHEPESAALSWPAIESPQAWPTPEVPAIEHHAASWGAPELPAPSPVWIDPEPAYAALLPAPEAAPLSTQAEIDNFIEVAWETAPAIEPEAPSDLQWLPAPEAPETSNDGGNDER